MKRPIGFVILLLGGCLLLGAQAPAAAGKFANLAKQLNLTPQQKMEMIPILESEAPKVAAIKSDTSLTKVQKLEQLKALHDQNDPKVRSILTSDQYQQLQKIRQQEIADAVKKKLPQ